LVGFCIDQSQDALGLAEVVKTVQHQPENLTSHGFFALYTVFLDVSKAV
jgi:hypothetical protein